MFAQIGIILSLSFENQTLAWPILNSTGLVSLVISNFWLNEKSSKAEILSISALVFLAFARLLFD